MVIELLYKKNFYLTGIVSGHSHLTDGQQIRTSRILNIRREEDLLIAETENTQYFLHLSEANQQEFDFPHEKHELSINNRVDFYQSDVYGDKNDLIKYYSILNSIISREILNIQQAMNSKSTLDTKELINKYYTEFKKCYETNQIIEKDLEELIHIKIKYIKSLLESVHINNNELYIDIDYNSNCFFKNAVIKDEIGYTYLIEYPIIHLGTIQDSVLMPKNMCSYDFRYFPRFNSLEIYRWDQKLQRIFFYNSGPQNLEVLFKDRNIIVEPKKINVLEKERGII